MIHIIHIFIGLCITSSIIIAITLLYISIIDPYGDYSEISQSRIGRLFRLKYIIRLGNYLGSDPDEEKNDKL